MIGLSYAEFKLVADQTPGDVGCITFSDRYFTWVDVGGLRFNTTILFSNTSDKADFEANYLPSANQKLPEVKKFEQTFTGTGTGAVIDISKNPLSKFTYQVRHTGAVVSWTVALEGSLTNAGANNGFGTIKSATNVGNVNIPLFDGNIKPVNFLRINVSALNLGTGTNIIVTVLGMK